MTAGDPYDPFTNIYTQRDPYTAAPRRLYPTAVPGTWGDSTAINREVLERRIAELQTPNSIQALQAENENLKAEIDELRGQIAELRDMVDRLTFMVEMRS